MANKKTKKITLNEFRCWLEGVEELQSEDWTPTKIQWQLIRNKINAIKEPESQVVYQQVQQQAPANNYYPAQSLQSNIPPAPEVPSSIPAGPTVPMSNEAKQVFNRQKSKTPDVDTSQGEYNSIFS